MKKKCTQCKKDKLLIEYHKDKSRKGGHSNRCKDCRCRYPKIIQKKCAACGDIFFTQGSAKARKYCGTICQKVHIKYGIDEYRLEDMLISSDYKCHICGNEEKNMNTKTGKLYSLSIDHCHNTNIVRGLLCQSCNVGIGMFKDNIESLQKAIIYLEDFNK